MGRFISFRGKRVDNGEWIEGDLIHNIIGHKCFIRSCELSPIIAVEDRIVCQNVTVCGEEHESVYEGDIVSFPSFNEQYNFGFIAWEYYGWVLKIKCGKKQMPLSLIDYEDWEQAKVVGNIYDNPELLNAKFDNL